MRPALVALLRSHHFELDGGRVGGSAYAVGERMVVFGVLAWRLDGLGGRQLARCLTTLQSCSAPPSCHLSSLWRTSSRVKIGSCGASRCHIFGEVTIIHAGSVKARS